MSKSSLLFVILISMVVSSLTTAVWWHYLSLRMAPTVVPTVSQSSPGATSSPSVAGLDVTIPIKLPGNEKFEEKRWQGNLYKVYEGTVSLSVSSLAFQDVERHLWVNSQGDLRFSVANFPVDKLPLKGIIVIDKKGFRQVVIPVDIRSASLKLSPQQMQYVVP